MDWSIGWRVFITAPQMSIMSSWLFVHQLYQNNKKRKSNLCIVSLCEENPPITSGFPHKWPVMQKSFPGLDAIMLFDVQKEKGSPTKFPSFVFSVLQNQHCLPAEYHVHIWQVSPQLSWCYTYQLWMWLKGSNRYLLKSKMSLMERFMNIP